MLSKDHAEITKQLILFSFTQGSHIDFVSVLWLEGMHCFFYYINCVPLK